VFRATKALELQWQRNSDPSLYITDEQLNFLYLKPTFSSAISLYTEQDDNWIHSLPRTCQTSYGKSQELWLLYSFSVTHVSSVMWFASPCLPVCCNNAMSCLDETTNTYIQCCHIHLQYCSDCSAFVMECFYVNINYITLLLLYNINVILLRHVIAEKWTWILWRYFEMLHVNFLGPYSLWQHTQDGCHCSLSPVGIYERGW
jgi:hypothetical protein